MSAALKKRWRIVRRDELAYLRGMAKGVGKLQRSAAKYHEWNDHQQQKLARLREQIECDQEYIDALETAVKPDDLKRIRLETGELRRKRARVAAE